MLVLGLMGAAVWLCLALGHDRFWQSGPVLMPGVCRSPCRVAAVIPARNEAEHVKETLQSLLAQDLAKDLIELRVVLVDDNSSDDTGRLARVIAATDVRLQVVSAEPLQSGWSGKMWAVAQGLQRPEAMQADYVLLTDADIIHGPTHVAALVHMAQSKQLDLTSEMVRLRCESLAERATIPAFIFFFQMLYPFAAVNEPMRKIAAAAGGTMLLSRAALDRVGGVDRIRGALIDDVALAREVKHGGHRIWLGHARDAVSGRRYPRFTDVWEMVARTAYVQLKYSPLLLAGTCAGMLLMYLLPVVAALLGHGLARWIGMSCWLVMAALFQPTLRRYRRAPLWGIALPGIALFYLGATLDSAIRFYRGRGGRWKDRVYSPSA